MWMMGCGGNDKEQFNLASDTSLNNNSRKLRPLMPKPIVNTTTPNPHHHHQTITPYCSCFLKSDLFPFNHRLENENQQNKNLLLEGNVREEPCLVSSRWNPTPEQLHILDDMYRCGMRTPTADQIQQIAVRLRRFGRIEGKNVFYWFQNHKARDRQKRRRLQPSADSSFPEKPPPPNNHNNTDHRSTDRVKESGFLNRTSFEFGEAKNWTNSNLSNCSTLLQESVAIQKAAAGDAESKTHRRIQFEEEREFQPSCRCTDQNLINNKSWRTKRENFFRELEPQTLQLFPVDSELNKSSYYRKNDDKEEGEEAALSMASTMDTTSSFTPVQFFEFLPLKN